MTTSTTLDLSRKGAYIHRRRGREGRREGGREGGIGEEMSLWEGGRVYQQLNTNARETLGNINGATSESRPELPQLSGNVIQDLRLIPNSIITKSNKLTLQIIKLYKTIFSIKSERLKCNVAQPILFLGSRPILRKLLQDRYDDGCKETELRRFEVMLNEVQQPQTIRCWLVSRRIVDRRKLDWQRLEKASGS